MFSLQKMLGSTQALLNRARSFLPAARPSTDSSAGLEQDRRIPYSARESEPISMPVGMVGREQECAALMALLEERSVVFLHGPARIGKTYLVRQVATRWKQEGRPFFYTCPSDRGIGDLFRKLKFFFWANGYEEFAEIVDPPEANDDDRIQALAGPLSHDRYLIVLDAFGQVDFRPPFQNLVRQACRGDFKGRLLVCVRNRPSWCEELPPAFAGEMALEGFCPEDMRAFARQQGFDDVDLKGLDEKLHPFVLQLLLFLAQQRRTSPMSILADLAQHDLERALLTEIYQDLEERDLLDRLSVLRLSFLAEAFSVFGGVEDLIHEKPVTFLVGVQEDGQHSLHPLARNFGTQRLAEHKSLQQAAHEQAVQYYQLQISAKGKGPALACTELGYHLLELDRPQEALDMLATHSREIVSFGYGRALLSLTRRIEDAGVVEKREETGEEARSLHDLALIYIRLPVFDIADNHLRAIRYCGRAITYYEEGEDPMGHASILNVQGMACSGLPIGDPRKNIHRAFESYREAFAIFQQYELPTGCAMVHNNMGTAWMELSALGGEWCIGRAIGHFKQAVRLYAEGVDPFTRALVESNLGHALCLLGKVEEGMTHFQAALEHFRLDLWPREYADTQWHMGDAHRLISSGKRSVRLTQAMEYYTEALTVYEEEIFPESFVRTQHFLGVAHRQLALYEDARKHQLLAIKCYRNALRVYTEEGFPFNHQVVQNNLDRDMQEE
jgi:tetratricopeptide (TPR) repeat protein